MQTVTLAELDALARKAFQECLAGLLEATARPAACCWVQAFLSRWSIVRHLRDLASIDLDIAALAQKTWMTPAEEIFLGWLRAERPRHEQAIAAEEAILAKLEQTAGAEFVRDAVERVEALQHARLVVEGGAPVPREGQ